MRAINPNKGTFKKMSLFDAQKMFRICTKNRRLASLTIRNSENMFRISGSGPEKAQNYAPKIDGWHLCSQERIVNNIKTHIHLTHVILKILHCGYLQMSQQQ